MNNPIQWPPLQSPGSAWPPHPASPATCAVPVAPAPPPSLPPSSDKHGSEDTEPEPGHRPEGPGQAGPGCPEAHAGQSCLLRVKDKRLLRYRLSPIPAETGTAGAQHQNTKGRHCKALHFQEGNLLSPFSPWGNGIFYPKGMNPPAASSFLALKVDGIGGERQFCSPLTPPISITVGFIFPDLSLLGFWGTALPWRSQVLFGEGDCLFMADFPHLSPFSKPCPLPQSLPNPKAPASCDTQPGIPLQQTNGQRQFIYLLPDLAPGTPTLHCSPEQTTACGFLPFRVTPSCHLLTATAPAPPSQRQHPSWSSSAVTPGL